MRKFINFLFLIIFSGAIYAQELKLNNEDFAKSTLEDENVVVYPSYTITASSFAIAGPLDKITITEEDNIIEDKNYLPWIGREKRKINTDIIPPDFENMPVDSSVQTKMGWIENSKGIISNFNGQTSGSFPPDCNGDIGINHYFQTVNTTYAIYNKTSGALVANGNLNTIFNSALTGATCNDGDPIVLWDEQAQRWFYSEFALCLADERMLIAVSQTSDPTGLWYSWSFNVSDTPDYMKFGIWQDGYYMATNTGGAGLNDVYVFERSVMLAGGTSPQMIAFDNPNRPVTFDGFHCIMPCDNDGAWAPAGTPAVFVTVADDGQSNPADALYIYELDVNWTTPASSTFARTQTLPVNAFSGNFNSSWDNIPQTGTTVKLDAISTVLMYRAQYRNFSGTEKIVCAHTIAETATEGAIRWYILERNGGSWSINQQSTYNPGGADGLSRWLPGIAMNGMGQVAMGFSVSSTSGTYPGIRIVGRSSCAPANTMDIAEFTVVNGGTYQSSYNRWGDYAGMTVDTQDDLSFWFTTEYMNASTTTKSTKFVKFTLDQACNPPNVTNVSPASLYEDRGKQLTITGTDLLGCTFSIGGVTGSSVSNNGTTAVINFPAGNYTNGTLTVTNAVGNDTYSVTVSTRNTIPVVAGATVTSDNHPTIESAVDGLYAWYGTTAFNLGDLPGTKTIEVHAGTYTEGASLTAGMNPTAANPLIIQNFSGEAPVVNATGYSYGIDLSTVDYIQLKGLAVYGAGTSNLYVRGDNCEIAFNKIYSGVNASGIKIETGGTNNIHNNLIYNNQRYAIHVVSSSNNTIKNNTTYTNGGQTVSPQNVQLFFDDFETSPTTTGWTLGTGWGWYTGMPYTGTYSMGVLNSTSNLTSPVINITGYTNLEISCYLASYGAPDAVDYLNGYYRLNGGTWIQFFTQAGTGSQINYTLKSSTAISASHATLEIQFQAKCGNSEYWFVEDVKVIGDWATPPTNIGSELYVESGTGTNIQNNIFCAKNGTGYYAAQSATGVTFTSSYNTYFANGNANLFNYNGTIGNTGPISTGDIVLDPQFVTAGTDFHLKSTAGSYHGGEWPPLTATTGSWTNDASNSNAIDAGNSVDAFALEPSPNGSRINQGAYGNTVQASKTPTVVAYNWTGAVSNDWQNTGNWSSSLIPTAGVEVTIPNGCPNYPLINDGVTTAACNNLTLGTAASITIAPNGQMTISGLITNNAGNTGFVIQSDATGTGSLIQSNIGGTSATVNRFLESSGSTEWHFLSSPITVLPVSDFAGSNFFEYDESQDDWWTGTTYFYDGTSGWVNPIGNLAVAYGYAYNYFQTTETFTGTLNYNSSGYTIPVPYTQHFGNAANGQPYTNFDGWLLAGNPFTSVLDWEGISKTDDVSTTVNYYDGTIANYAYYQDGGITVNGGTRYIPAMQGFFIKTDDAVDGGNFEIPNSARVHNSQAYWKEETEVTNLLRFELSSSDIQDEAVVAVNNNSSINYETNFDAIKMFAWVEEMPQIYTLTLGRETELAINTFDSENSEIIVPVGYKTNSTEEFTIRFTENSLADYYVYLIDNELNTEVQISEGFEYNFTGIIGIDNNRFELKFVKNITPVVINSLIDINLYVGQLINYTIPEGTFYDGNDGDILNLNAYELGNFQLPFGLTFNTETNTISGVASMQGNYDIEVVAEDNLGASVSDIFRITVDKLLDINEFTNKFVIYPNPSRDIFYIAADQSISKYSVKVKNSIGITVYENDFENEIQNKIDLTGFASGMYYVIIDFGKDRLVLQKIIID